MYPVVTALSRRLLPVLVLAPVLTWIPVTGGATGIEDFLAAEQALQQGDQAAFASLSARLRADPLYPYLRYAELTRDLAATPDGPIEDFLAEFPDTPLAERLRGPYLKRLAAAGRWVDLVRVYREDDADERRCLYLRALVETGQPGQALTRERMGPLWLKASSQPAACDPLFAAWRAEGGLDLALVWARIRLAMEAGETGLARHLGTWLPEVERPWLALWLEVQARPALILAPRGSLPQLRAGDTPDHPMAAAILGHGIARLSRSDPAGAARALAAGRDRVAADQAAWDRAHAAVGLALTQAQDATGLEVWDLVHARADNLEAQEARLRAGLRFQAWDRVADWVERMPDLEEKRDRWLYWQGRALAALGREEEARAAFGQAARQRSLWGLLAADRLGLPYALNHRASPVDPERVRRIEATPALARIRALRRLGRDADMRREWRTLTRNLDGADLMAAAVVADALGWHDQAIFTLVRTGWWDDLALRFPLQHRDLVEEQAWQSGLPEDWIFAVIRQESVFNPSVASSAGALGLMQLMPATARAVAADLSPDLARTPPGRTAILQPGLNIALGSGYLTRMRDRFGHAALATAAYNAGPHRVDRWLPPDCMDADLWIATIPFEETRGYVERVLAYRVIYRDRLGLDPVRISELLPPVWARPVRASG